MPATVLSVQTAPRPWSCPIRGGGVAVAGVISTSWLLEDDVQPPRELGLAGERALAAALGRDQCRRAAPSRACGVPGARDARIAAASSWMPRR